MNGQCRGPYRHILKQSAPNVAQSSYLCGVLSNKKLRNKVFYIFQARNFQMYIKFYVTLYILSRYQV